MPITPEEIHLKKQELGLEPPEPTKGPEGMEESFAASKGEAVEAEAAELIDHQNLDQPEGTNQRNQYRYGGLRP